MVQPSNPKEVQRTLHYCVATYRERNFETGRTAKELLTKPAARAFLWALVGFVTCHAIYCHSAFAALYNETMPA